MSVKEYKDSLLFSREIRINSLTMVFNAKSSHIGSAFSITDIIAVLYTNILSVDPNNPDYSLRDRFILSKGHACVAVYAALALKNFFPLDELEKYGTDYSNLMAHISHYVPGVEFSTGSLGHGLPFAIGKAYYAKKFNKNWLTYTLLSDGELGEGSNWEAILFAAHHKLNNLIAILDYNNLQSLTTVKETLNIEPIHEKLKSFGWNVIEVDGHNHKDLQKVLSKSNFSEDKPNFVIAHTIKGKGVSFMENKVEWHYKSPSKEELALALKELKIA